MSQGKARSYAGTTAAPTPARCTLVISAAHVLRCAPALAASVAELVDALDSKSSAERRAGSIPAGGTNSLQQTVPSHTKNPRLSWKARVFLLCCVCGDDHMARLRRASSK